MGQATAERLRSRFGADVLWLPFDLHPEYPPEGIPRAELLARYGGRFHNHVREMFERNGLVYSPNPDVVPNSRRALQLTELARELGLHGEMHDRLMDAYRAESQDIGDAGVLRRLASEVGLPDERVERVLTGDDYLDAVRASTGQAVSIGVSGVPAFLLDQRLLVLGAQPDDVFEQAFEQLRDRS